MKLIMHNTCMPCQHATSVSHVNMNEMTSYFNITKDGKVIVPKDMAKSIQLMSIFASSKARYLIHDKSSQGQVHRAPHYP